ncbi:MAG: helix-turn-helix transcriptional regulator [Tannerellaceae bacterium]|jgi:transcriptional regulator with XRE-family HTH domain|nr:helix-turn-helix transcriptional regulator [Tannerellaceae bacterium]
MNTESISPEKKEHQGKKVKRIRELLGVKQEDLAERLDTNQQSISRLESKEEIDNDTLLNISRALKVPVDAIKNFSEDIAINIVANTFQDEAIGYANHYKCTFNPLDKVVELYERIIKEKEDRIRTLEEKLKNGD